jgi:prepilin-type N-terminal cleavage/methylation domain-containing protein
MLGGKNSKNKHPRGYTIVEVMIVLAVSGVMFLIAANFINGKQAKTAFTDGVNDTASRLQDTIEQVTDGQYSDIPLNCTFNAAARRTSFPSSGTTPGQGQNSQCVFLGKLWYFGLSSLTPKTSEYQVLPVAGGRVDQTGAVITTPAAAGPAVVRSLSTDQAISQSLDVTQIYYYNGSSYTYFSPPMQAFGFLQGQGSLDTNGNLASGAQTVGLYYVGGALNFNNIEQDAARGYGLQATKGIAICVTDDQRHALITVGIADAGATTGNPLSVDTDMNPRLPGCGGAS